MHWVVWGFVTDNILILIFWISGAGDVWFSIRNTTYQNKSIVALEDIGKDGDALLCVTNLTACCQSPANGNWFFPNGTGVPNSDNHLGFHAHNQRSYDGVFAPQKRWRARDLQLCDTWFNECYPDHIRWSVLNKQWWVIVHAGSKSSLWVFFFNIKAQSKSRSFTRCVCLLSHMHLNDLWTDTNAYTISKGGTVTVHTCML